MRPLKLVVFDLDDTLADTSARLAPAGQGLEKIKPFPGVTDLIEEIHSRGIRTAIVTTGVLHTQREKVESLGLRKLVGAVLICPSPEGKATLFQRCFRRFNVQPQETLVVGDRIDREIQFGKALGCVTVRVLQGRHCRMVPTDAAQLADFTIQNIAALRRWFGPWLSSASPGGKRLPARETQAAARSLPGKRGEALIRWYVETMETFRPKGDEERNQVLAWISRQLRIATTTGCISASSVIDHFFSPLGLETSDILLPKYPPVLDSLWDDSHGPRWESVTRPASSDALLTSILQMKREARHLTLRVAGGAGGGKSTFARNLVQHAVRCGLRAKSVGMDAYAFPRRVRLARGLQGLAMYEWDNLRELAACLGCGKKFYARISDRKLGESAYEAEPTDPSELDLFVFEGILTLASKEFSGFDLSIYIDESDEKRFQRRLERDRELKDYSPTYTAWTFATTQWDEFPLIRKSAANAQMVFNYERKLLHTLSNRKLPSRDHCKPPRRK